MSAGSLLDFQHAVRQQAAANTGPDQACRGAVWGSVLFVCGDVFCQHCVSGWGYVSSVFVFPVLETPARNEASAAGSKKNSVKYNLPVYFWLIRKGVWKRI